MMKKLIQMNLCIILMYININDILILMYININDTLNQKFREKYLQINNFLQVLIEISLKSDQMAEHETFFF